MLRVLTAIRYIFIISVRGPPLSDGYSHLLIHLTYVRPMLIYCLLGASWARILVQVTIYRRLRISTNPKPTIYRNLYKNTGPVVDFGLTLNQHLGNVTDVDYLDSFSVFL